MMRSSTVTRDTKETSVTVTINIDGKRQTSIDTGIGFLDHMLTLFAFHGDFDLAITCKGDLEVDAHHTVEDTGIILGKAFREALGEDLSIVRYGSSYVPMDETLSRTVIDISGRSYLVFKSIMPIPYIGEIETESIKEFFQAFAREARVNLHMETLYGENTHHIIESLFKSFARALSAASRERGGEVSSTKGAL
ncbi:imidazoleglycerol-phosphate dehydratase HisB [candidate division KSB1 bacterium]